MALTSPRGATPDAGFLLGYTFSFDDFIIAFFVAGSNTTLPIYVFSSIRRGITPTSMPLAARCWCCR